MALQSQGSPLVGGASAPAVGEMRHVRVLRAFRLNGITQPVDTVIAVPARLAPELFSANKAAPAEPPAPPAPKPEKPRKDA